MSIHDDIIKLANSLIDAHGEGIPIQAALRAQGMLAQGDWARCARWRRIGSMRGILLSHAAAADVGVP